MRSLLLSCAALFVQSTSAQSVQPPRLWSTCAACHATEGTAAIGPPLAGVLGRKAGSVPAFGYSRAMKKSTIVWDEQSVAAFVTDPQQVVPGNRMPFAGVSDPNEVAELVTYLKALR